MNGGQIILSSIMVITAVSIGAMYLIKNLPPQTQEYIDKSESSKKADDTPLHTYVVIPLIVFIVAGATYAYLYGNKEPQTFRNITTRPNALNPYNRFNSRGSPDNPLSNYFGGIVLITFFMTIFLGGFLVEAGLGYIIILIFVLEFFLYYLISFLMFLYYNMYPLKNPPPY